MEAALYLSRSGESLDSNPIKTAAELPFWGTGLHPVGTDRETDGWTDTERHWYAGG